MPCLYLPVFCGYNKTESPHFLHSDTGLTAGSGLSKLSGYRLVTATSEKYLLRVFCGILPSRQQRQNGLFSSLYLIAQKSLESPHLSNHEWCYTSTKNLHVEIQAQKTTHKCTHTHTVLSERSIRYAVMKKWCCDTSETHAMSKQLREGARDISSD